MKKLLSGIVAIVLFLGLATNVEAATMFANKSSFEVGDTVTVTVDVKDTDAVGIWLKYNPTVLEFKNATSPIGEIYPTAKDGVVKIGGASATAKNADVTFTFTAVKEGTADFSIERFDVEGDTAPAAVSYSVAKKSDNSTDGKDDGKEEIKNDGKEEVKNEDKKEAGKANGTQTTKKVNDQGEEITKLPKTGTSYIAVAGVILAVIGGIVLVKKINK